MLLLVLCENKEVIVTSRQGWLDLNHDLHVFDSMCVHSYLRLIAKDLDVFQDVLDSSHSKFSDYY